MIPHRPRKETAANRRKVICEELAKLGDDDGRKLGAMKVIPADVFASLAVWKSTSASGADETIPHEGAVKV